MEKPVAAGYQSYPTWLANSSLNSGTCNVESGTDFSCECLDGFMGDDGGIDIDECAQEHISYHENSSEINWIGLK